MRPGIKAKRLNTKLQKPDDVTPSEQNTMDEEIPSFGHSIGILFQSSLKQTTLRVKLSNPTVYVLTVGMQDLLDWVVSGFGFSTMRR